MNCNAKKNVFIVETNLHVFYFQHIGSATSTVQSIQYATHCAMPTSGRPSGKFSHVVSPRGMQIEIDQHHHPYHTALQIDRGCLVASYWILTA